MTIKGVAGDVALLRVDPIDLSSDDVEVVCLPEAGAFPASDQNCFIGGWGNMLLLDDDGRPHAWHKPTILQTNWNKVLPDDACSFFGDFVPSHELCATKMIDGNICLGKNFP